MSTISDDELLSILRDAQNSRSPLHRSVCVCIDGVWTLYDETGTTVATRKPMLVISESSGLHSIRGEQYIIEILRSDNEPDWTAKIYHKNNEEEICGSNFISEEEALKAAIGKVEDRRPSARSEPIEMKVNSFGASTKLARDLRS